ncbi:MAG: ABC transporter permease subunit [Actinomycetota bacterium]|nr:ABC transporter permease subunit [Actinomycetota bacterium]
MLWGVIFGVYIVTQENAFVTAYPTLADRTRFAASLGSDSGTTILFGPAYQLQTVGGFTAWKCLGIFSLLGAVWALLISTRLLRGEEDAGRWELLLAGQTTRGRAAGQASIGLGAGLAALFVITALVAVGIGHSSRIGLGVGVSLYFSVACVASAAMFLGIGALASQLAPTRRQAASYAAGLLGVSFVLRMVADSAPGMSWLRWAGPLGWVEELQPLTQPRPIALLPIAVVVVATFAGAACLARVRDLDASIIADRAHITPHTRLLGSQAGLTVRLTRGVFLGWAGSIATMSLILGLVAKSAGTALEGSASVKQYYARLGIRGTSASDYLGLAFLIVALLIALAAVGQVTGVRGEEASGRLEPLLVRPVPRRAWLGGRLGTAAAALIVLGLVAGLATWAGAASEGAHVSFAGVLEGGLNLVPPALCILGLAVLAFGVWPRATTMTAYAVLGWAFLIEVIGGALSVNHWILDTSVLHQLAAAPAVSPDWTSAAVLVGIGAVSALIGGMAFSRRDLAGD